MLELDYVITAKLTLWELHVPELDYVITANLSLWELHELAFVYF